MADTDPKSDVSALTVQLLSAYLANNTVPSESLAELIRSTKAALTQDAPMGAASEPEQFTPAVSVRKSLASPEHIISLIDGKPYKTLKRHLASHGLTPDTYRSRYNLPPSYPLVAPAYADHRRAVAQRLGLGRKPAQPEADEEQVSAPAVDSSDTQVPAAAAAADVKAVKKSKTAADGKSPRAAKKSPGKTGTPAGENAEVASTNNDQAQPSAAPTTQSDAKPARKTARSARTSKVGASKTSASASEPSGSANDGPLGDEPVTGVENPDQTSVAAAPKRRGKIGLFKGKAKSGTASSSADQAQPDAAAPSSEKTASSERAPSNSSAKGRNPKRMARSPKPEVT